MRVVAVGTEAVGVIALGQRATGIVAVGQLATGVVAVGQLSRGVIAVGQLSCGVLALGQLAVGGVWGGGMLAFAPSSGWALVGVGPLAQWVPWRRDSFARRRPGRSVTRHVLVGAFVLACVAIVVLAAIRPLAHELLRQGGILRDVPAGLR